ncbi:10617_t:CDS:2, partial [Scutellospora calospora]
MPKVSKIKYYAVHSGRKLGIYYFWEECKDQIHRYPGALFRSFEIKQQAEDYINNLIEKENIFVWTDGCCENNGKKDARAGIGVYWLERNTLNLSKRLPGKLQTNNRAEIFARHRGNEGNEQADKLAYLESQKPFLERFNNVVSDNHHITDCPDYKKQNFNTWWQDDFQSNFHRPIMYSDNKGHIVEELKKIIRSHKWYKKEANIVDENDKYFVNYMFLDIKIDKIKFKNNYSFDL